MTIKKEYSIIKEKLYELGFKPSAGEKALANYKKYICLENFIFISGQLPMKNGKVISGKIESSKNHSAVKAIKIATVNFLLTLDECINENKIDINSVSIVNLKGFLNTDSNFSKHPELFNNCSDLVIEILGYKNGSHSRSVIGVNSLPLNAMVEIEGIVSISKK